MEAKDHPPRARLDVTEEVDSDVVVLVFYDSGLAGCLLRSVAARVVGHAHCSVYVVRQADR